MTAWRVLLVAALVAALPAGANGPVAGRSPRGPIVAGAARFTVVSPTLIRLEYQAAGTFVDSPSHFASLRPAYQGRYRVEHGASGAVVIDTGRMLLRFDPDGTPFHPGNLQVEVRKDAGSVVWTPAVEPLANLGGASHSLDTVWEPIALASGLIARDGWALIDDSQGALRAGGWYADRPVTSGLDWFLFGYGDDFHAPLVDLTRVAGPVPLPRRYQLGSWFSRWALLTSDDFRTILDEYDEHGFPLDVLVLDMNWHRDGWTGWSWERALLPDAEELLAEAHARGLAVTLNLHPGGGVAAHEDRYEPFMAALGEDPLAGHTVPFDAGNREYLDVLEREVHAPLAAAGADFWWLDYWGPRRSASVASVVSEPALNRYYFEMTSRDGLRGAGFSRWGGWGDHRHPMHFSGDTFAEWATLGFQIAFTATSGNSGCFFWTHDIGGFKGRLWHPFYPELYARWIQFGALSAALRVHSSYDKRPWRWGDDVAASAEVAFGMRARLFPYIYTAAAASARSTWPLIRPMYLEHPRDERAYRRPLQYLLGDALLVAPITTPGTGPARVAARSVWLPAGRWYNLLTSERHDGDREILVSADLGEVPVYARGGVPIPMQSATLRMAGPAGERVVRCWPGADGEDGRSELYEDDGLTQGYAAGEYATTQLSYRRAGDRLTVQVAATVGGYDGQASERETVVELAATGPPRAATIDGAPVVASYDAATRTTSVRVPPRSIRAPMTVTVVAADADRAAVAAEARVRRLRGILGTAWVGRRPTPPWSEQSQDDENALLAVDGYGIRRENEGPYLHDGPELFYAYAPAPVPVTVQTFSRSSFRPGEELFIVRKHDAPVFPLHLDVQQPGDIPAPPVKPAGAIGERREQGISVVFEGIGEARWSRTSPYTFIERFRVSETLPHDPGTPVVEPIELSDPEWSRAAWRTVAAGANGVVDLRAVSTERYIKAYAVAGLRSATEQDVTLAIASDDGCFAWLDGRAIYDGMGQRFLADPELVAVRLAVGLNTLVIMATNHVGDWGLSVGVVSAGPVWPEVLP